MTERKTHLRAVLVGALTSPYLPETLAALAAQTRAPSEIVIASLSADGPEAAEQWTQVIEQSGLDTTRVRLVPVPGAPTFGAAVRRALRTADDGAASSPAVGGATRWLWLLHDDSAPEPRALEHLLTAVDSSNSIALAGAKQVEWDEPERLISVGVRATRWGRRFTGIEDGEIDQGQHDGVEDVLAVGTAGMLIEADLWRRLGGPDPVLGPFEDGRDLSQRARLAGQRVVVVPRSRVRHARAGYRGLRADHQEVSDSRLSFRERRKAVLHLRLASAAPLALPFLAVLAVLAGPVRALWRVSTSELGLAVDELIAPLAVLAHPRALARARSRARRTRTVGLRALRPLQADWREGARLRRDRRMQAAAARRAARAPSELEIAERAVVARRRRLTMAAVLLIAAVLSLLTVVPVAFSPGLIGGALLPSDASFIDLWRAATSSWIASGDGFAGPPDPFLLVLTVVSAVTGGPLGVPVQVSVAILLVLAIPLAALNAWFAAGAATRSVLLRAWTALAWALGPALLIGLGAGRLGAVVAHVMLPLVLLAVVRSLGLDRRDVVISGMVGAQRVARRTSPRAGKSAREVKRERLAALAHVSERDGAAGQTSTPTGLEATEPAETSEAAATTEVTETDTGSTSATTDEDSAAGGSPHQKSGKIAGSALDWTGLSPIPSNTATAYAQPEEEVTATMVARVSRAPSLGAAAAAGLALTAVVCGAPVLLGAAVLATVLVALGLGRRRRLPTGRARLILVLLPAVVALAPLLLYAAGTAQGWRVLFADPGVALASDPGPAWLQLFAWPQHPTELAIIGGTFGTWAPLASTAVIAVAAVAALLRGAGRARAVRIGWLLVAVGLVAALVASRVAVGVGSGIGGTEQVVYGWAGPGTSLVLAGLLLAVLSAADGLRGTLSHANFGWRQVSAAVGTVVVLLALTTTGLGYTSQIISERSGSVDPETMLLHSRGVAPVPALGLELQRSAQQSRVLMLTATTDGVSAQLWRGNGPQLTETATTIQVQRWAAATGGVSDPANTDLQNVVAQLVSGTTDDAATALASHAIAVVLVPPADSGATGPLPADPAGRSAIIARLNAAVGLDRVTENSAGVIWRVSLGEDSADSTIARIQLRDGDGAVIQNLPASSAHLGGQIGADGRDRTVVLADRSDSAWRAWLGGAPLRAGEDSWHQTFLVPDGATGDLVLHHRPLWYGPWRVAAVVIGVLTVLLALPTRRRRGEVT